MQTTVGKPQEILPLGEAMALTVANVERLDDCDNFSLRLEEVNRTCTTTQFSVEDRRRPELEMETGSQAPSIPPSLLSLQRRCVDTVLALEASARPRNSCSASGVWDIPEVQDEDLVEADRLSVASADSGETVKTTNTGFTMGTIAASRKVYICLVFENSQAFCWFEIMKLIYVPA